MKEEANTDSIREAVIHFIEVNPAFLCMDVCKAEFLLSQLDKHASLDSDGMKYMEICKAILANMRNRLGFEMYMQLIEDKKEHFDLGP